MWKNLANEKVWVEKPIYADAEKNYHIQLAKDAEQMKEPMAHDSNNEVFEKSPESSEERSTQGRQLVVANDKKEGNFKNIPDNNSAEKSSDASSNSEVSSQKTSETKVDSSQVQVELENLRKEKDATSAESSRDVDKTVANRSDQSSTEVLPKLEKENEDTAAVESNEKQNIEHVTESNNCDKVKKSDMSEDPTLMETIDKQDKKLESTETEKQNERKNLNDIYPLVIHPVVIITGLDDSNSTQYTIDSTDYKGVEVDDGPMKYEADKEIPSTSSTRHHQENDKSIETAKSDAEGKTKSHRKILQDAADSDSCFFKRETRSSVQQQDENGFQKNSSAQSKSRDQQGYNTRYQQLENASSEDNHNQRHRSIKPWYKRRQNRPANENAENTGEGSNGARVNAQSNPPRQWRNNRRRGDIDVEKLNTEIINLKKILATQERDIKQTLTREFEKKLNLQETVWKSLMQKNESKLLNLLETQAEKYKYNNQHQNQHRRFNYNRNTNRNDVQVLGNNFRVLEEEFLTNKRAVSAEVQKLFADQELLIQSRMQQQEEAIYRYIETKLRSVELEYSSRRQYNNRF